MGIGHRLSMRPASAAGCARDMAAHAAGRQRRRVSRSGQAAQSAPATVVGARRLAEGAAVPTNGAAIAIRGCFQTTLTFLWVYDVFAHVAMSEMANTITITDRQFSNVFGPCSICAAGGIGPPVGLWVGSNKHSIWPLCFFKRVAIRT